MVIASEVGTFWNDVYNVGNGGIKVLTVGTERKYIQDGPLNLFPPATRLAGVAALATGDTASLGTEIQYAVWSGEPYTLVPIYIQSTQQSADICGVDPDAVRDDRAHD